MWSPLKPFFLALSLGATAGLSQAQVKVGDIFPALTPAGFDGVVPRTTGQVVLVDFWASWCAPCRASFPAYARLEETYGGRGLVILAVSVDQHGGDFAAFVRKFSPTFSTVRDRGQALVKVVAVPAMPTSYLLGRDGVVRFVHAGFYGDRTERELRQEIQALLQAPIPPS
jgi:thiol-disulfide isomerase/thioredoxin